MQGRMPALPTRRDRKRVVRAMRLPHERPPIQVGEQNRLCRCRVSGKAAPMGQNRMKSGRKEAKRGQTVDKTVD